MQHGYHGMSTSTRCSNPSRRDKEHKRLTVRYLRMILWQLVYDQNKLPILVTPAVREEGPTKRNMQSCMQCSAQETEAVADAQEGAAVSSYPAPEGTRNLQVGGVVLGSNGMQPGRHVQRLRQVCRLELGFSLVHSVGQDVFFDSKQASPGEVEPPEVEDILDLLT